MELVFFWMNRFRYQTDLSCNFSPEVRISYKCGKLHCSDTQQHNIFQSKNLSNVTAIIGSNGSGKTMLLKALLSAYENVVNKRDDEYKYIIVFGEKNAKGRFTHPFQVYSNLPESKNWNTEMWKDMDTEENGVHPYMFFYSNVLNADGYVNEKFYNGKEQRVFSLSTMATIKKDCGNPFPEVGIRTPSLLEYFQKETIRQVKFVKSEQEKLLFPIHGIYIQLQNPQVIPEFATFKDSALSFMNKKIQDLFSLLWKCNFKAAPLNFCSHILLHCSLLQYTKKLKGKNLLEKIEEWERWTREDLVPFLEVMKDNEDVCEIFKSFIQKRAETILQKHNKAFKNISNYLLNKKNFWENKDGNYDAQFFNILLDDSDEMNSFKEMFSSYKTLASSCGDPLIFRWDLSSGESAYLAMLSRFYEVCCSTEHELIPDIPVIVLLDEADMHLHAEWQRKFLMYVLDAFIRILFPSRKVQLIITTHSPIFLSDIPLQHVVCLGDEHLKRKTFAANIYHLYQDAFFLKRTSQFGIIGEYARTKILEMQTYFDILDRFLHSAELLKNLYEMVEKKENGREMKDMLKCLNLYRHEILYGIDVLQRIEEALHIENIRSESFEKLLNKLDEVIKRYKQLSSFSKGQNISKVVSDLEQDYKPIMVAIKKDTIIIDFFKQYEYIIDNIGEDIVKNSLYAQLCNLKKRLFSSDIKIQHIIDEFNLLSDVQKATLMKQLNHIDEMYRRKSDGED